jgi:hypothetical protein
MQLEPTIVDTERLHDGALVLFSDGRSAIYSPALLLSVFDQAEDATESLQGAETSS